MHLNPHVQLFEGNNPGNYKIKMSLTVLFCVAIRLLLFNTFNFLKHK